MSTTKNDPLCERLAAQARELFAHLPAGTIGDDEALHFTVNRDGSLSILVDGSGDLFTVYQGRAARCKRTPIGVELTVYRDGKLVELLPVAVVPKDEGELWAKAPKAA